MDDDWAGKPRENREALRVNILNQMHTRPKQVHYIRRSIESPLKPKPKKFMYGSSCVSHPMKICEDYVMHQEFYYAVVLEIHLQRLSKLVAENSC